MTLLHYLDEIVSKSVKFVELIIIE